MQSWGPGPLSQPCSWARGSHPNTPVFQANNDILAFLSGMPVTRNTKYLDLKNSVSQSHPASTPCRLPLSLCRGDPSRPPARCPCSVDPTCSALQAVPLPPESAPASGPTPTPASRWFYRKDP